MLFKPDFRKCNTKALLSSMSFTKPIINIQTAVYNDLVNKPMLNLIATCCNFDVKGVGHH